MIKTNKSVFPLAAAFGIAVAMATPALAEMRINFVTSDVQAAQAGQPTCYMPTGAEIAAAVNATNQARLRAGLKPVKSNSKLSRAAARHACDMAARGRMAHAGSATKGPSQRVKSQGYRPSVTAENIAAGPFGLRRVLTEWNRSSGHRANIMIPQTRDIGIGRAVAADGRTVFWAAVYAAPKSR